jgi:glycosyltransferase involved in cell wall biosynthesis
MSGILFSIVIPTYNRASFIIRTIESVLSQSYRNFEIIVIDDGSTDDTAAVMATVSDKRVHYVQRKNAERGAARNAGASLAKGEFVNFVDSDDLLYDNHLATAHAAIQGTPTIDVFHIGYDVKDTDGNHLRDSSNVSDINKQVISGNLLSCNGVFIRRTVALENPFCEDRALASIEDWELWIRLASKYNFIHIPTITSTVINHEGRSVMSVNTAKIKAKTNLFINLVSENKIVASHYGNTVKQAIASALTYTALHLAIAKSNRSEIVRYTIDGLKANPGEIFRKRFLVILKLLVLR